MEKSPLALRRGNYLFKILAMWNLASITSHLSKTKAIRLLEEVCNLLFEIKLTHEQTVYLFYAQLAATATLFPMEFSLGWRAFFLVATVAAIKRSGLLNKIKKE